jgi:UDP-2,3-diacylglucosamine pyrophosphatase LpxH
MDGIIYYNDGDWVESCTALVEDHDGHMHLLDWAAHLRARSNAQNSKAKAVAA